MRIASLVLSLVLGGCFGDSTPVGTGDGGASSGGGCIAGQAGCACYPNGTCDAGLTCVTEADVCVADDCTPGEIGCTCVDGQCLGDAVCEGGVCNPPGGGSASGTSGSTTSMTTSVDEGTGATSDGSTSVEPDTSAEAASVADTGGFGCPECFDAATTRFGTCGGPAAACMNDPTCAPAYGCVSDCAHQQAPESCLDECCAMVDVSNRFFPAFATCVLDACGGICPTPSC